MTLRIRTNLAAACLAALVAVPLAATPRITSVSPPGGQRGTAVQLVLEGSGLSGRLRVHSEVPGSLTELTADADSGGRHFLLEIGAAAPPGAYRIAVETDHGVSNAWLFSVSDLPEIREKESLSARAPRNDSSEAAQVIAVPVVVSGTLTSADRDRFRVGLEAGQRVTFEVEARRLGSAVDPVLAVSGPDGRLIGRPDDSPGVGGDARISLEAAASGDYLVEIRDSRFSDQSRNFYRLVAGPVEYAEAIFPLGWKSGESVEVELSGGTLAQPERVVAEGEEVRLPDGRGGLPIPFLRSDDPEILEPEAEAARLLSPSTVVNGRIEQPGEVDSYRLDVKEGEQWLLETQAAVLGTSQLYTLLTVSDQNGTKLGSAGDQPPEELLSNISVRSEAFGDPALGLTVPEGVSGLRVDVEDLLGRGGPGYSYRLVARRQPGDFIVRLDDTHVNIPRGGATSVSFTMDRRGYDGPVRIIAENLPPGVTAEGGNIPAEFGGMTTQRQSLNGRLMFAATEDAESARSQLSLYAEGTAVDGSAIRRPVLTSRVVTPVAGTRQRPVRLRGPTGRVDATVTVPPPATIEVLSGHQLRLIQGQQHVIKWAFHTHQPGVRAVDPIRLINGPAVANLRILGDAKIKAGDKLSSLDMNTTMGTPAMRFDLVLQGRVRHEGAVHQIYSRAIAVDIVQGYEVGAPTGPVSVQAGGEFQISGSFARRAEFDSEVVLEAANLPAGVSCRPLTIGDSPETYSLSCEAEDAVESGDHLIEVVPRSVLAGRDKEAVPYNISPVEAVLAISREG